MKRFRLLLAGCVLLLHVEAQTLTPDRLYGELFVAVQKGHVFPDNKTFVDCTPRSAPHLIVEEYNRARTKPGFDLKSFVLAHFDLPAAHTVQVPEALSIDAHLEQLWNALTRSADTAVPYSSLLPLPHPYVVPGGRFREIYYWDSYFTMQGLAVNDRYDLIRDMLDNFAWFIQQYGHIPNGNRNYYLSRAQPPFFALMVQLLQQHAGDSVLVHYLPAMEKEYAYWMQGAETLSRNGAARRVVRMPDGSILNRYWDDYDAPRQESFAQDAATALGYSRNDGKAYRNLRAAAESGWDFSSRWFDDTLHLNTIATTDIVPVDLNALLYADELILAQAERLTGKQDKARDYQRRAAQRKAAVLQYCWNERLHFFFDYDRLKKHTTDRWSMAGVMPLSCRMTDSVRADLAAQQIRSRFLRAGGVVATPYHTGQQWDAPNGWAPMQFMAVVGLRAYHQERLADDIATRWLRLNRNVFAATGRMLEKYNVEDLSLPGGGGEYPTQDGFGWTNGVFLALENIVNKK